MKDIVIDTNILVSALRSRNGASYRLVSMIGEGVFRLNISVPLIVEYEDVLKREIHDLDETDIRDVIDYICRVARSHKIFYLWRPTLKDAADDFILELAVKSRSAIVTHNTRDFRKADSFGIDVMTPKEFLESIGAIS